MRNKKAFSFVELIIVVTILLLLAVVSVSISNNIQSKTLNSRVEADLVTLNNAFKAYESENKLLPLPEGNRNYYSLSGAYRHDDFTSTGTYGVYGKVTENLLPKAYLDHTPLDPRTNNYYAYGLHRDRKEFEVAGVLAKDDYFIAQVSGNYKSESGLYSLIREYNGPNFVINKEANLPYNPYEKILLATDSLGNIYKQGDTIIAGSGEEKEIYFSDGSVVMLEAGAELTLTSLDFPRGDDLVSKVKLALDAGVIWVRATRLFGGGATGVNDSEFEITTAGATAAVRGTVFRVEFNPTYNSTYVDVVSGKVEVTSIALETSNTLTDGQKIKETGSGFNPIQTSTATPPDFTDPVLIREIHPIGTFSGEFEKIDLKKGMCYFDGLEKLSGETFSGYTKEVGNCGDNKKIKCENGKLSQEGPWGSWGDKEDKYIISSCCLTTELDGDCVVGNKKLLQEGYQLYAYAPYNEPVFNGTVLSDESFKMYSDTGAIGSFTVSGSLAFNKAQDTTITSTGSLSGVVISTRKLEGAGDHNFYSYKYDPLKTVGFLAEIVSGGASRDSGLGYGTSALSLTGSLAIEMRVMLGEKQKANLNHYLFQDNNNNYILNIKNKNIEFKKILPPPAPPATIIKKNIDKYIDDRFHTIIYKQDAVGSYVYIDDIEVASTGATMTGTSDYLKIGGSSKTFNFGNLIDYVKIYK